MDNQNYYIPMTEQAIKKYFNIPNEALLSDVYKIKVYELVDFCNHVEKKARGIL
jgi:hypothetical protein